MTDREILLKKLSSYQFMMDDLQLYLDTHPNDTQTIAKIKDLADMLEPLRKTFEAKYGPLFDNNTEGNKWMWINNPWPWENEEVD